MALPYIVPAEKTRVVLPEPLPARTDRDGDEVGNLLLLSIPDHEFSLVRPLLEPVDLPRHELLYEQGARIRYAYFVNEGMVSLVIVAHDGRSVEVGISGRDALVGLPLVFDVESAPTRAIVQLPGQGLRIPAQDLETALTACPQLQTVAQQYAFSQLLQVAQLAACNRLHDLEQRLARWLLMCEDTVDSSNLPLTHEFMAQMLGTVRPTVTIAAGVLERSGLIENTRGSIKIVNRKGLEEAACECYRAVQNFAASRVPI